MRLTSIFNGRWLAFVAVSFTMSLLGSNTALAHDLWLVAPTYRPAAGDTIWVLAATGGRFPESEVALDTSRIARCRIVDSKGAAALNQFTVIDSALGIQVVPRTPGIAIVELTVKPRFIRLEAEDFNGYLEHEGLTQILELRRRQNRLDEPGRENYSKYAKALLRVGGKDDDGWKRILGHRLEIVPEKNPFKLKAGESLPVRLLYEGKPLADVQITWGHEASGGKVKHTRTDAEGRAAIQLDASGRWFVHALHMIERPDNPDIDYESFWATITFEVP